jgi:hypothetical protein
MSDPEDLEAAAARFDKARRRVAIAAALLQTIDLDLLAGFYARAASPQAIAAGTVSPSLLPALANWQDMVEAARALRDAVKIEPDVLATLEEMFSTMRPEI